MTEDGIAAGDTQLRIPELTTRARKRRNLAIGAVVLVAAGIYAYYARPEPPSEQFRTVAAATRTVVQRVEAAGRLDVRRRVEVPAPLAGRLLTIHVHEGDTVVPGQKLATLDQRASVLSVRSAEAAAQAAAGSAAEARAALAAAERTAERARSLQQRGFGSAEDVQKAESELARARAVSESAKAEQRVASQRVASAELEQSLAHIDAPVGGVVLRAPEREGAAVGPEQGPLFLIGDPLTTMRVDASLSETDVPFVKPGFAAEVTVIALPGRTFNARVEHIGIEPSLEGGAVLYPVRLAVDNPDGALLPGMSARVRIEVGRAEKVLTVHEGSLRFTPQGEEPGEPRSRVYKRVGPNELESIPVRAGISDGTYTAVTLEPPATLREGDALVVGYLQVDSGSRGPTVKLGKK